MRKVICTLLALWMGLFSIVSVATTCCPTANADQAPIIVVDKPPCHEAEASEVLDASIVLDGLEPLSGKQDSQGFCESCPASCQCIAANVMLDATPVLNAAVNAPNGVITRRVDAVIVALPINPFRPPIA